MCKYREKLICLLARFFFHSTEWDLHNVWWAPSFSFPYIFLLLGSTESTVVIWLSVFDCENQAARRARTEERWWRWWSLVCLLCFCITKWFLSRKCNIFKMIYDDYLSDTKTFHGKLSEREREKNERMGGEKAITTTSATTPTTTSSKRQNHNSIHTHTHRQTHTHIHIC